MKEDNKIDEKRHIQEVYTDKASNLLKLCIGLLIFDFVTYVFAIFVYSAFDFGFIFEIIAFIFVIKALKNIKQQNFKVGKKNVIISMIPIGWLIIYDFINLLVNIEEVIGEVIHYYTSFDQFFYYLEPYLVDVLLVAIIALLYLTYSSITKAEGRLEYTDYSEEFYDKL